MEFLKGKNWWIEIRYPFHIARCAWACKWPTLIAPILSPLIKNIITFGPTAEAVVSFVVIFCKYNENVKNTRHVNSVRCEFDSRKWIFYLRHEYKTWLKHTVVGFPGVSVRFVGSTGVVGGGGPTYYEKIMFKYQMRGIC